MISYGSIAPFRSDETKRTFSQFTDRTNISIRFFFRVNKAYFEFHTKRHNINTKQRVFAIIKIQFLNWFSLRCLTIIVCILVKIQFNCYEYHTDREDGDEDVARPFIILLECR